jgi:hypothetical protein
MVNYHSNPFFILLMCIFQLIFTSASRCVDYEFSKTNNNDLQKCLSSSLPLTVRTVYPCDTSENQNSSQYQCDQFNVSSLSAILGGKSSPSPGVVVYVRNSEDVQNVVKCATELNYIVNALGGGHSYERYGLGSVHNNIIINMQGINYININQNDQIGTFGAGAKLGPIYYTTYQYDKLTINGGDCAWVGIAGQILGGGYGYLVRLYGLLSDRILEIKAINAQGKDLNLR